MSAPPIFMPLPHLCHMQEACSRSRPYTCRGPCFATLVHVHVHLRIAREIIALLSVTDTYIQTYIETISEMRCGISCLALRRSAIILLNTTSSAKSPFTVHIPMVNNTQCIHIWDGLFITWAYQALALAVFYCCSLGIQTYTEL